MKNKKIHAPFTQQKPFTEVLHGIEISDQYRWLEADSKERIGWIAAQNNYTNNRLKRIKGRPRMRSRLKELLMVDTIGPPGVYDGSIFYYKNKNMVRQI